MRRQAMVALLACGVACGVALLSSGCDRKSDSAGGGSSSNKKFVVAVIPKGTTHVFWQSIHAGAIRGGKATGAEIRWSGPPNESDRAMQIRIVDDMLTQQVNAVCLAPVDSKSLIPAVEDVFSKGIPIIIFDSGIDTDKYTSFVATDNREGGRVAGRQMLKLLPDGGEIAILRVMAGSQSTTEREEGFLDVIKPTGKFKVVADPYGDSDRNKSLSQADIILGNYPNLKGFYGPNESSTFGILRAMEDRKIPAGKIKFVGFDSSEELAKGLDEKKIDALVLQNPVMMGELAVKAAVAKLKGENIPKNQPIAPTLITQENMHEPAMQDLLHPKLGDLK